MGISSRQDSTARSILISAAILGAIMLSSCSASPPDQPSSSSTYRGLDLPSVLKDVGRNPDRRSAAEVACAVQIDRGNSAFPFEYLVIGLLDLAEADAETAFCQALVEGVIAGEITESDIAKFQKPRSQRGLEPLGDFLRKIIAAHIRLTSQQA